MGYFDVLNGGNSVGCSVRPAAYLRNRSLCMYCVEHTVCTQLYKENCTMYTRLYIVNTQLWTTYVPAVNLAPAAYLRQTDTLQSEDQISSADSGLFWKVCFRSDVERALMVFLMKTPWYKNYQPFQSKNQNIYTSCQSKFKISGFWHNNSASPRYIKRH